jgi:hypothetical protein
MAWRKNEFDPLVIDSGRAAGIGHRTYFTGRPRPLVASEFKSRLSIAKFDYGDRE